MTKTKEELEVNQTKAYEKQQAEIMHMKKFISSVGTYANLVRQGGSPVHRFLTKSRLLTFQFLSEIAPKDFGQDGGCGPCSGSWKTKAVFVQLWWGWTAATSRYELYGRLVQLLGEGGRLHLQAFGFGYWYWVARCAGWAEWCRWESVLFRFGMQLRDIWSGRRRPAVSKTIYNVVPDKALNYQGNPRS
jgi:hypothetical protein